MKAWSAAELRQFSAAALAIGSGTIQVDGHPRDVVFQRVSGDDDRIGAAYRQR